VHLVSGGFARAGIMQKQNKRTTSTWLPYIRVADVAATVTAARAAGGKVVLEPIAMNRATVAIVADPTGAPVGIVQLPAAEAQP
jgi:predicted enzyme related to lactoylglutathione lyase